MVIAKKRTGEEVEFVEFEDSVIEAPKKQLTDKRLSKIKKGQSKSLITLKDQVLNLRNKEDFDKLENFYNNVSPFLKDALEAKKVRNWKISTNDIKLYYKAVNLGGYKPEKNVAEKQAYTTAPWNYQIDVTHWTAETTQKEKIYGDQTSTKAAQVLKVKKTKFGTSEYPYSITLIETSSRKGFCYPIKDKSLTTIAKTLDQYFIPEITDENDVVKLKRIQGDYAFEPSGYWGGFINKYNVELDLVVADNRHIVKNSSPLGFIDRFTRTIKDLVIKLIRAYRKRGQIDNWVDVLEKALEVYNDSVHSVTKSKPDDLFNNFERAMDTHTRNTLQNEELAEIRQKYAVGEKVRIYQTSTSEAFGRRTGEESWSKEVYVIDKMKNNKYYVYQESNPKIKGRPEGYMPEELISEDLYRMGGFDVGEYELNEEKVSKIKSNLDKKKEPKVIEDIEGLEYIFQDIPISDPSTKPKIDTSVRIPISQKITALEKFEIRTKSVGETMENIEMPGTMVEKPKSRKRKEPEDYEILDIDYDHQDLNVIEDPKADINELITENEELKIENKELVEENQEIKELLMSVSDIEPNKEFKPKSKESQINYAIRKINNEYKYQGIGSLNFYENIAQRNKYNKHFEVYMKKQNVKIKGEIFLQALKEWKDAIGLR
jgi:hypothetical protein